MAVLLVPPLTHSVRSFWQLGSDAFKRQKTKVGSGFGRVLRPWQEVGGIQIGVSEDASILEDMGLGISFQLKVSALSFVFANGLDVLGATYERHARMIQECSM